MIFVVADQVKQAERWCGENNIPPYGRDTRFLTGRSFQGARGHQMREGDRIVVLGQPRAWPEIWPALAPACNGTPVRPEYV